MGGPGTIGRLFVEINSDTKALNTSMQQAIAITQAAGIEMTKAGKSVVASFNDALNPTVRLTEQVKLLEAAGKSQSEIWAVMGDRLKSAAEITKQHGQAVDPVVQKMLAFGESTKQTGFHFENLGKTLTDFAQNPLEATKRGIGGMLESLGPVAVGIGGITAAVGIAAAGLFKFVEAQSETWKALKNLSLMTGYTVADLQALTRITKEAGLEGMDLGRVLSRINEQLGKPEGAPFERALAGLGITPREGEDAIAILDRLGEKLRAIPNEAERSQVGMQVLGVRYRELLPLILQSNEGLAGQIETMKKSGMAWDDLTQNRLERFHEAVEKIGRAWEAVKISFMTGLGNIASSDWWKFLAGNIASGAGLGQAASLASSQLDMAQAIGATAKATDGASGALKNYNLELARYDAMVKARKDAEEERARQLKEQKKLLEDIATLEATINRHLDIGGDKIPVIGGEPKFGLPPLLDISITGTGPITPPSAGGMSDAARKAGEEARRQLDEWARHYKSVAVQMREAMDYSFQQLTRSLSQNIVEWKGWGDSLKNFLRQFAADALDILLQGLLSPIKQILGNVATGLGNWIGGGKFNWGGILSGAGGAAGAAGGAGAGGAGGAGAAASLGGFGGMAMGLGAAGAGLGVGLGGVLGGGPAGQALGATIGGIAGAGIGAGMSSLAAANALIAGGIPAVGGASAFMSGMAGLMTNPITIGIGAAAGLAYVGYRLATGPDAYEATVKEIQRDLGIDVGKDQIKAFLDALGITEAQAWGIRKELYTNPLFITQIAAPIAYQQGKLDTLLQKLGAVSTSWGTFDLASAFKTSQTAGNWSAFNSAWSATVGQSASLRNLMPGAGSNLQAVGGSLPITISPQIIITGNVYGVDDLNNRIAEGFRQVMGLGGFSDFPPVPVMP